MAVENSPIVLAPDKSPQRSAGPLRLPLDFLVGRPLHETHPAINAGALLVNGSLGSAPVTVSGGTLGGVGVIGGPVSVGTGSRLAPGAPLGTLTISNTLTLAGNTLVSVSSGANGAVAGLTSVGYGGTLTVTNLGGDFHVGSTFKLFTAGSASGSFSSILGNPGNGLFFAFNPTNGILSVQANFPTNPTNLTCNIGAHAITVDWPSNYTGWILQAQTNPPSVGISTNWVDV
jgi:uncharacterized protein with beta-barrel porin domain